MSFFYPSPAAQARKRQGKDSQNRISTSGASRRVKDGGGKARDERSSPPQPPTPQGSIYNQQNVGLEQIPDTPLSGKASPMSVPSPTVSTHQPAKRTSGVYHNNQPVITPAALQQYLDNDQEDEVASNAMDSPHLPPMTRSDTNTKEMQSDLSRISSEDKKSVKSEPVGTYHDRTPTANDTGSTEVESRLHLSLSRTTSQTGQPSFNQSIVPHERSFTPPAPPGAFITSQSPPPFASPVPVRAPPMAQSFMSYLGNQSYYGTRSALPSTENSQHGYPASSFYHDYAVRPQQALPAVPQRSLGYETPSSPQAKSKRRSVSYAASASEDETNSIMHRINTVLPDFQLLLDRYREVSMHVTGDSKPKDEAAEARTIDAVREKDTRIADLMIELQDARDALASECTKTQAHLDTAQETQSELEAALRSRDELQSWATQAHAEHDILRQHAQQHQTELDRLHADLAQRDQVKADLTRQVTDRDAAATKAHEALSHTLQTKSQEIYDKDKQIIEAELRHLAVQEVLKQEHASTIAHLRQELSAAQADAISANKTWRQEAEDHRQREGSLREAHRKEMDTLREAHREELGNHRREHESRAAQWTREREDLRQHHDARLTQLAEQHRLEKEDLRRTVDGTESGQKLRCIQLERQNGELKQEAARLRSVCEKDKARWEKRGREVKEAITTIVGNSHMLMTILERMNREEGKLYETSPLKDGDKTREASGARDAPGTRETPSKDSVPPVAGAYGRSRTTSLSAGSGETGTAKTASVPFGRVEPTGSAPSVRRDEDVRTRVL